MSNTSAIRTFVTSDFLKLLKFGQGKFGEFMVVHQIHRFPLPKFPSAKVSLHTVVSAGYYDRTIVNPIHKHCCNVTTITTVYDNQYSDVIILLIHCQEAVVKVSNNMHMVLAMYRYIVGFLMSCFISFCSIPVHLYIDNIQPATVCMYVCMLLVSMQRQLVFDEKLQHDHQGNSYVVCSCAGVSGTSAENLSPSIELRW